MTDGSNGNGKNGLLRELTETRERTAAWLMRFLILGISGSATIALYLAAQQFQDLKADIASKDEREQQAISALTQNQERAAVEIGQLSTTISGYIVEEQDHEQRLRSLEHARMTP